MTLYSPPLRILDNIKEINCQQVFGIKFIILISFNNL
nr:MAG TPA: hypothetical protein [Herelleviridae sp.]